MIYFAPPPTEKLVAEFDIVDVKKTEPLMYICRDIWERKMEIAETAFLT